MNSEVKEMLATAGINAETLLERSCGNESLAIRLLGMFLDDTNYEQLVTAMKEKNPDEALAASHTLKGVSGNLAMDTLYERCSTQVKAMRAGDWETAEDMMDEIGILYRNARAAVEKVLAAKK